MIHLLMSSFTALALLLMVIVGGCFVFCDKGASLSERMRVFIVGLGMCYGILSILS